MKLRVSGETAELRELLRAARRVLADLARVEETSFGGADGEAGASVVLRSGAELFLPLADVIDLEKERSRIRGELERVEGMLEGTRKRLANEAFVSRAPAEVVQKEREKVEILEEQRDKLSRTLRGLERSA